MMFGSENGIDSPTMVLFTGKVMLHRCRGTMCSDKTICAMVKHGIASSSRYPKPWTYLNLCHTVSIKSTRDRTFFFAHFLSWQPEVTNFKVEPSPEDHNKYMHLSWNGRGKNVPQSRLRIIRCVLLSLIHASIVLMKTRHLCMGSENVK